MMEDGCSLDSRRLPASQQSQGAHGMESWEYSDFFFVQHFLDELLVSFVQTNKDIFICLNKRKSK